MAVPEPQADLEPQVQLVPREKPEQLAHRDKLALRAFKDPREQLVHRDLQVPRVEQVPQAAPGTWEQAVPQVKLVPRAPVIGVLLVPASTTIQAMWV